MRLDSLLVFAVPGQGTPMYAARSPPTCANCHVGPTKWENPPVPDRKCNMSCQSCHIDPAGGGVLARIGNLRTPVRAMVEFG